jgi:hypothetical protein
MGKISGSGSGMNNPDHICGSVETVLKFNDADPGWKNSVPDPGSATLLFG